MGKGSYYNTEKEGPVNIIEWLTHSRVGTHGSAFRKVQDVPTALRMDDYTTANTIYLGWAEPGADESAAVWRIKKIDTTAGVVTTWAGGNEFYVNVWDDRASLSYS